MTMNRREAIRSLTYSAALFGLPASVISAETTALPSISLLDGDPDAYWNRLREEQFLMPGKRAFLNTGSVGVAARPVVKVVCDYLEQSACGPAHGRLARRRCLSTLGLRDARQPSQ
jgi:hypothetical protein